MIYCSAVIKKFINTYKKVDTRSSIQLENCQRASYQERDAPNEFLQVACHISFKIITFLYISFDLKFRNVPVSLFNWSEIRHHFLIKWPCSYHLSGIKNPLFCFILYCEESKLIRQYQGSKTTVFDQKDLSGEIEVSLLISAVIRGTPSFLAKWRLDITRFSIR